MKKIISLGLTMAFVSLTLSAQPTAAQGKTTVSNMICYRMKNGKIYEVKNNKEVLVKKDVTLKNGTIVMPNGDYKLKDGKTMMLKNGECVDEEGNIHQPSTPAAKQKRKS